MKSTSSILFLLLSAGVGTMMAGPCPPTPPTSRGNGMIAGVPLAGGMQYYFKDALPAGFDCFDELSAWFPSYIHSTNSISPTQTLVDMAYAEEGTATFLNVVAPASGNYTLTFRYALPRVSFRASRTGRKESWSTVRSSPVRSTSQSPAVSTSSRIPAS
jgi:hypothetical protein